MKVRVGVFREVRPCGAVAIRPKFRRNGVLQCPGRAEQARGGRSQELVSVVFPPALKKEAVIPP
jgi:hypothetical protein